MAGPAAQALSRLPSILRRSFPQQAGTDSGPNLAGAVGAGCSARASELRVVRKIQCASFALIWASTVLILPLMSRAASYCYSTEGFPSAWRFEQTKEGFRAYLQPQPVPQTESVPETYGARRSPGGRGGLTPDQLRHLRLGLPPEPTRTATLLYSPKVGFSDGGERPAPQPPQPTWLHRDSPALRCAESVPETYGLTPDQLRHLRSELQNVGVEYKVEQKVSACARDGDTTWLALGFYSGEGVTGVGGIGRYDSASRQLEVHRPEAIRRASATSIAVFGETVWVGTAGFHECVGYPPKAGLIQYKWGSLNKTANQFIGGPEVCGFVVHDMLRVEDKLWVATDLGLTEITDPGGLFPSGFRNFVPDSKAPNRVREVTCEDLYDELLITLPNTPDRMGNSPFRWFFDSVVRHASWYTGGLLREMVRTRRDGGQLGKAPK